MKKYKHGGVELYVIGGVPRIRDKALTSVFRTSLKIVRKLIRMNLDEYAKRDSIETQDYTTKGENYARFLLTASQFDLAVQLFSKFKGLEMKLDKNCEIRIRQAFDRYMIENGVGPKDVQVAHEAEIASLNEQHEDLRRQIIIEDLPEALFHLLSTDSPLVRDLMSSIDNLVSVRVQQAEARITSMVEQRIKQATRSRRFIHTK